MLLAFATDEKEKTYLYAITGEGVQSYTMPELESGDFVIYDPNSNMEDDEQSE